MLPDPLLLHATFFNQQPSITLSIVWSLFVDCYILQYTATLYIQKSVSENTRNAILGVEKYKNFRGECPQTPLLLHTTFFHQQPSVISPYSVQYGPFL
jgi:hypothetical protein